MAGAPTPQTLLEAIASSAGSPFITNPIPEAPTGTLAASIQGGFPAVTMTDVQAGGKPPLGQDQNGFLFLISSHTMWVECGQLYLYNSDLATAIDGYLAGTVLGMSDGTGMWLNRTNGNTTDPDAGGAGWVPMAAYGRAAVTGLTGGTVNLTAAQSKYGVIVLTGALTSNLTINFPQTIQEWLVINGTSGAFTTTLKTAATGSAGVSSPQGGFSAPLGVYSVGDGNIYPTVAPLSVPIDQNPTPLTLVERTNLGYVLAAYFHTTASVETASPVGTVYFGGTGSDDDGLIRKSSMTNFEGNLLLQGLGGQLVNGQVPYSVISQWASTFFTNAALTGVPTVPTAGLGVATTQAASTSFVNPGSSLTGAGPWFRKNPDGSVDQWGATAVNIHVGAQAIGFGVAFPNVCQSVTFSVEATAVGYDYWLVNGSKTVNGFQFNNDASAAGTVVVNWRATGR